MASEEKPGGTDVTLDASDARPPTPAHTGPGALSGWNAADLPVVDPQRYSIEREFARGGMGRILTARDRRLGRSVALKELIRVEADPSARFVREALVTARLQHPAIVPVYEAGRWPTGEPFYAMKLVSGRPLVDVLGDLTTLEERLALLPNVASVAEAIAYAHSEQVIHRDLKPANILVGDFGETVVIDWGLAKDLREAAERPPSKPRSLEGDDEASSVDGQTIEGSVMGTPAYMAPEQARGETVTPAADVYALGAILYHLLAGEAPYVGRTVDEILDRVVRGALTPLVKRAPGVPRDLRAIVEKAMARDIEERYPTAKELAEDLRRFQTGQLIGAHDYSTLDRARLWVRRHRMPVFVVGLLLAALAATAVLSVRSILDQSRRADRARRQAERKSDELTLLQAGANLERDPTASLAWLRRLSAASPDWSGARVIAADALSRGVARDVLRGHQGAVSGLGFALGGGSLLSIGEDRTARVWDLARGRPRVLGSGDLVLSRAALSPDGKWLVSASNRRSTPDLTLWDVASGTPRKLGPHDDMIRILVWAPDGRRVLAVGSAVALWETDAAAGADARRVLAGGPKAVTVAAWAEGGVVAGGQDGQVVAWNAAGEPRTLGVHAGPVLALATSPDARWVASAAVDGVKLWALGEGAPQAADIGDIRALAWTPDGATLGLGGRDGSIWAWAVPGVKAAAPAPSPSATVVHPPGVMGTVGVTVNEPAVPRKLGTHAEAVQDLIASLDSRRLMSAGSDHVVRIWDIASGDSRALLGHDGAVLHLALAADGTRLASAGQDGSVRVWDTSQTSGRVLRGHIGAITSLEAAPEGRTLASASLDHTVRLWNLATGSSRVAIEHAGAVRAIALSSDGRHLASAGDDGVIGMWSLTEETRKLTGHQGAALTIAFAQDGATLASGGADGTVREWNVGTGQSRTLGLQQGEITQLLYSPDGAILVTLARGASGGSIQLWGQDQRSQPLERPATRIAISAGGRLLAAAGADGVITVWDLAAKRTLTMRGHEDAVRDLAFAPDRAVLASGGQDKTVRLWDLSSGRGRVLGTHTAPVTRVLFASDGRRLVSASEDATLRLWDLGSGKSRALRGHTSAVTAVVFSADGERVLAGAADGTLRLFADELPIAPRALRAWLDSATRVAIDDANVPATQER